ncbi:MAG: VCBS repeat-containing protein [Saprospiraceae bacterium]|nr:VCBS repeat-containing protein [Saprospiraceae bacterium]
MKHIYLLIVTFVLLFGNGCKKSDKGQFTLLEKDATGLDFRNMLKEDENFNIFKYQYYYNGGGIAIADFDNDGLQDVFFTGNMVKNRLFRNKGNLKFDDVTEKSGVAKAEGWCTGANAIDINNDGWMDLYICRAGYPFPKLRKNLLYINNKNLTFTEQAAEYGLDDDSYSTHAAFFDYDKDGDLDMFLLNHSAPEYSKGSLEIVTLKTKENRSLRVNYLEMTMGNM